MVINLEVVSLQRQTKILIMRASKWIYENWTLQRLKTELKKRRKEESSARIKRIVTDLQNEINTR